MLHGTSQCWLTLAANIKQEAVISSSVCVEVYHVSVPCFFLYLKLVETKTLPLPEFKFEMALEYL